MDTAPLGFDPAHCLAAALGSRAAYFTGKRRAVALQTAGFRQFEGFSNMATGTEGFVAVNDQVCLVAFRGTQQTRDFVTDARFNFHPETGYRVHAGFYRAFSTAKTTVIAAVERLQGNRSLVVTGHSLGGGLACLFSAFSASGCTCYTFGQPRVGDRAFSRMAGIAFGRRHFRVVNEADLIPRLPGPLWPSYRHSGQVLFFMDDGSAVWNPSFRRAFGGVLRSIVTSLTRGKAAPLDDHRIQHYVDRVISFCRPAGSIFA